jgi:hypothetical protein
LVNSANAPRDPVSILSIGRPLGVISELHLDCAGSAIDHAPRRGAILEVTVLRIKRFRRPIEWRFTVADFSLSLAKAIHGVC